MLKLGVLSLTIAILAACGVYGLKNRVQMLEKDLVKVEREIEKKRIDIKRLRAEWATLSRPDRLARLSETHLKLIPAEPRQIVGIADVPMRDRLGEDSPALVSSIAPSDAASQPLVPAGATMRQ
ncbi:MAG: cell division protein FtsL [Geminicoccaceae bacterium]